MTATTDATADAGTARGGERARPARPSPPGIVLVGVSALLAVVLGAVFVLSLDAGGAAQTGPPPQASTGGAFPGAPRTQRDGYGVADGACPLAAPNPYLPVWSGCVAVRRADLAGAGHQDLILLYSRLSHHHVSWPGAPASLRRMYLARQAVLEVVPHRGGTASATIAGAKAAAFLAIAHVNDEPGDEIFLQVSQVSSGAAAVAYGYHDGRLVPAGVTLAYGGDSADKAGFDCLAGPRPRLLQRTFVLIGPSIYGSWNETDVTYIWHGPRLVKADRRTFERRGLPPAAETTVGAGCVTGIGRSS